jgi:hypothetical protein
VCVWLTGGAGKGGPACAVCELHLATMCSTRGRTVALSLNSGLSAFDISVLPSTCDLLHP